MLHCVKQQPHTAMARVFNKSDQFGRVDHHHILCRSNFSMTTESALLGGSAAPGNRLIEKRWRSRVGIEQAHLAPEHIDELRERLDPGGAKELTNRGLPTGPARQNAIRVVYTGPES